MRKAPRDVGFSFIRWEGVHGRECRSIYKVMPESIVLSYYDVRRQVRSLGIWFVVIHVRE